MIHGIPVIDLRLAEFDINMSSIVNESQRFRNFMVIKIRKRFCLENRGVFGVPSVGSPTKEFFNIYATSEVRKDNTLDTISRQHRECASISTTTRWATSISNVLF